MSTSDALLDTVVVGEFSGCLDVLLYTVVVETDGVCRSFATDGVCRSFATDAVCGTFSTDGACSSSSSEGVRVRSMNSTSDSLLDTVVVGEFSGGLDTPLSTVVVGEFSCGLGLDNVGVETDGVCRSFATDGVCGSFATDAVCGSFSTDGAWSFSSFEDIRAMISTSDSLLDTVVVGEFSGGLDTPLSTVVVGEFSCGLGLDNVGVGEFTCGDKGPSIAVAAAEADKGEGSVE